MSEDESDQEWKFSVDEFEDSSHPADSTASGDHAVAEDRETPSRGDTDDAPVAGEFAPEVPVVPEMPKLENAAMITLGSVLTILAFASVVGGAGFGLTDAVTVVVIVGGLGALAYGAFVRLTPDT